MSKPLTFSSVSLPSSHWSWSLIEWRTSRPLFSPPSCSFLGFPFISEQFEHCDSNLRLCLSILSAFLPSHPSLSALQTSTHGAIQLCSILYILPEKSLHCVDLSDATGSWAPTSAAHSSRPTKSNALKCLLSASCPFLTVAITTLTVP